MSHQVTPPTPIEPPVTPPVTPPTPPTPLVAVTIKLFAADSQGNVLKDASGDYLDANTAYEGGVAKYIAYAFKEGETTFNDTTKLATQAGSLKVEFTNGTAAGIDAETKTDGSEDFINNEQTITIGTAFKTDIILDTVAEGDENFTVAIKDDSYTNSTNSYKSVEIKTEAVTTTIKDAKIFVKIEAVTDTAQEGGSLKYKVSIVNSAGEEVKVPVGNSIIVNLDYADNGTKAATSGDDYTPVTSVTIVGGESFKTFDVVTKDDYYAEGDEGLKITIGTITNDNGAFVEIAPHTKANDAPSDAIVAIGTIKDNPINNIPNGTTGTPTENTGYGEEDNVYAIITGSTTVNEGNTTTYTVSLVDKDNNPVIVTKETEVTVKYTNTTTQDGDTEHNNNALIIVKIPANGSSNTFTVESKDDYVADNSEKYNVAITKVDTNEFENVVIGDKDGTKKDVTTEILDDTDTTPNIAGTVETDHELVILKIVACDASGNPILDGDKYTFINDVNEGADANYMIVAFKPNTTEFTTANKTPEQGGTVTIKTANDGATGATSATKIDGSQDYISETAKSVTVGTAFTIKTIDDYRSDNDEKFTVAINNNTYAHPTDKPLYENVTTNTDAVTTTIKDNTTAKNQTVIESSVDNSTTPSYGKEDTVFAKITANNSSIVEGGTVTYTVKLVDKNGADVTVKNATAVTVTYTSSDTTKNVDTPYVSGETITVTIPANGTSNTFTIKTIDDFVFDGAGEASKDEQFKLEITDVTSSEFENIVMNDGTKGEVTTTIKEGVTVGTPINAKVDEDSFVITDAKPQISVTESLGIQKPNADNTYALSFDTEVNNIKVYKGDADSSDIYTGLKSGGKDIAYVVSGDTITGYAGTGRTASDIAFTIKLNKDSGIKSGTTTKDGYTYTQFLNIDHPVSGSALVATNDDNITLEFGFKITDQGQTGEVKTFKVTVNDSMPFSGEQEFIVNEDSTANKFIISQENFKNGEVEISNDGTNYTNLSNGGTIAILDPNDASKTIGTLTNNGDGTVTFVPIADYSNYAAKPSFSYKVSDNDGDYANGTVNITVRPVADKPTITVPTLANMLSTTEDNGNLAEGTNKVALGLLAPIIVDNKNQNDSDSTTGHGTNAGDHPERLGHITLTFTNGDKVIGAKIFKADDSTPVGTEITGTNKTLTIVIVKGDGTVDYDYHHADINTGEAGVQYLTKAEYEALKIQHAEDNDTDIKINIKVTSYEVDDSGKPLNATDSTYADRINTNLAKEANADMVVKINPVTDDISLNWNNAGSVGSFDTGTKIFTFNSIAENTNDAPKSIDLKALLSETSGALNGTGGSKADLDGSEKRSYTISKIPEGTIVTLGGQKAIAGSDGIATLVFNDVNNKLADPDFSIEFPKFYSGTITDATITLKVYDKGVDAGDTAGVVKSETVKFSITVDPVAQQSTIQVGQSVGFEDAGRDGGNTDAKNGAITDETKGIPLNIKVTSDDKDGSEKFTVTIKDIPKDSGMYVYDKSTTSYKLVEVDANGNIKIAGNSVNSGVANGNIKVSYAADKYSVEIVDFQNGSDKAPKFIPPHNDDSDHTLKVSSVTNDGTSVSGATEKDILVVVKNIADAPEGITLNGNIPKATEDTLYDLKSIYNSTELKSSDDSEELTVRVVLQAGFVLVNGAGASIYNVDGDMYVVKASDINSGKVFVKSPENFSGDATIKLTHITTETAGENDSKTWNTQTVNIFVNPVADNVTVAGSSTIYEDNQGGNGNKINLQPTLTDTDAKGIETIENVYISKTTIDAMIGKGYKLYINGVELVTTSPISKEVILTNETTVTREYYAIGKDNLDKVTVLNSVEHKIDGNFNLDVAYEVKDINNSVSDTKIFEHAHEIIVKAVTDTPDLEVTETTTTNSDKVSITNSGKTITVSDDNTEFTVKVNTSSPDKDNSEEAQRIEIHGVPKGVTIDGAEFKGYTGEDSGVWVIIPTNKTLDNDGVLTEIKFTIESGSDFTGRDITIKTFTKDVGAEEKTNFLNIRLNDFRPGSGTGPGTDTTPDFELTAKSPEVSEDTKLTLDDFYSVASTKGKVEGSHWATTITGLPEGTKVEAINGATMFTYGEGVNKHYVISGTGQQASDIQSVFKNIEITPPKDVNTGGHFDGKMTISGTISSTNKAASHQGATVEQDLNITSVTDKMTIDIAVSDTNEDITTNLTITLSNPSDGSKAALVGNSITIKVTENWADTPPTDITKGTLTQTGSDYTIAYNNTNETYTITKTSGNFTLNNSGNLTIPNLVYTPAENRDGKVTFEVSVENKEGNSIELTSTTSKSINITPVVDMLLNGETVTATGKEDEAKILGSKLANAVELIIANQAVKDNSESFGNIVLDDVPNGFTVWYIDSSNNLVMAINVGKVSETTFNLTPHKNDDSGVTHTNKWLIPNSGNEMPKVYINAPENWAGAFDFGAKFTVTEENESVVKIFEVITVDGNITPVADGVTIDPTLTFGDAFSWVDLKLNANMLDTDGSEVMGLEITGLGENSQFRFSDGTMITDATYANEKWTVKGIPYDQINNIQFTNDKSNSKVEVKAWTEELTPKGDPILDENNAPIIGEAEDDKGEGEFDLVLEDVIGELVLDKGVNIDFSLLDDTESLKGITTIDMSAEGENKILNLTAEDVLDITDGLGEIIIKGDKEDTVTFTNNDGWTETAGSGTNPDVYTNSGDPFVQVKVEQAVTDQII